MRLFKFPSGLVHDPRSIYWCPLIGAYTGARREEIAGLALSDIIEIAASGAVPFRNPSCAPSKNYHRAA